MAAIRLTWWGVCAVKDETFFTVIGGKSDKELRDLSYDLTLTFFFVPKNLQYILLLTEKQNRNDVKEPKSVTSHSFMQTLTNQR